MKCQGSCPVCPKEPVAPYAGAWIEICTALMRGSIRASRSPTRERGLKFNPIKADIAQICGVAPYAGAWIEIKVPPVCWRPGVESLPTRERGLKSFSCSLCQCAKSRSPTRGAWIEIAFPPGPAGRAEVAPTRERGLKFPYIGILALGCSSLPYAGAWIEMPCR